MVCDMFARAAAGTGKGSEKALGTITIEACRNAEVKSIQVPEGQSLLKSLRDMGFSIKALCGERGICGSCRVRISRGELPAGESDISVFSPEDLAAGWRLACTARPASDIDVEIPVSDEDDFAGVIAFQQAGYSKEALTVEEMQLAKSKYSLSSRLIPEEKPALALLQAAGSIAAETGRTMYVTRYDGRTVHISNTREHLYAVGIDIGTTTIGFALVDLQTATIAGRLSVVNRQREYGADVVTRIVKAREGALSLLSGTVRTQLAEGISRLCDEYGVPPGNLVKVAIAGNTTMLHLLLELNCSMLGSFPFTPVTLDYLSFPYRELFSGAFSCNVDILPGVSAYVGADITAGLLYLMMHRSASPAILLDIGTNGEMALAKDGGILCTSTAAGPALEGVNILCGTGSVPGAISSVCYDESGFSVSTIGGQAPVGICGSGVIDCVYQCLLHGIIDETGRFQKEWAASGAMIAKSSRGEDICFCQKDIREVQLAKSAIRSGLELLLRHAGIRYNDVGTLYIAGGFGYNIDFTSGVGIGLVPEELKDKIKLAGNSSLGGVVSYLLNPEQTETMREIVRLSSEFSLSEDESFQDLFIEHMSFPSI